MKDVRWPKVFRHAKYVNLRGIIDCTELYIEKPFLPSSQRHTFSHYKPYNTLKFIGVHVTIMSFKLCVKGSISDKEIVRQSGFLDFVMPGDAIMANKGFNIQDLLAIKGAVLIAPPIMSSKNVSSYASTATRRMATSRVHVKRIIRKIKCFSVVRGFIPLTLH